MTQWKTESLESPRNERKGKAGEQVRDETKGEKRQRCRVMEANGEKY